MTKEEKLLLLKDLCARVPYVTFVYVEWHETEEMEIVEGCEDEEEEPNIHTLISCNYYGECDLDDNLSKTIYDIKPYLRHISSMTDEEKEDFGASFTSEGLVTLADTVECMDWLNAHQFDYRGLIPMGLALEAPEGMYKTDVI